MRYAILLRGVNVGGKRVVPMAELTALLTGMGFGNVRTLLQSGNAALDADLPEDELLARVRSAFEEHFGFACGMTARSADELHAIAANPPFPPEAVARAEAADPQTKHLYAYFLESAPGPEAFRRLFPPSAGDALAVGRREIFLLCEKSVRLSPTALRLAAAFPAATARNWNTVEKLAAITEEG